MGGYYRHSGLERKPRVQKSPRREGVGLNASLNESRLTVRGKTSTTG
jgi:hypothetical protein